ncbi:hypothetical protein MNBD_GAMMA02-1150, partial [hydrothermal vent metagenome]
SPIGSILCAKLSLNDMMLVLKTIFCLSLLFCGGLSVAEPAQPSWQLKIDRIGIQVFQQQQAGFKQKHSKGVMVVKAQSEQVMQLLQDLSLCSQWLYGCLSATRHDDGLIHIVVKGPLWFKDRDVVFASERRHLKASDQWLITTDNQPTMHPNSNYVRVNTIHATWILTTINSKKIQISYEFYVDPQIKLKSGVNKYNRDALFLTLRRLRKLLRKSAVNQASNPNQPKP